MINRAQERMAALRQAHAHLVQIAHLLEPAEPRSGAEVRQRVEAHLAEVEQAVDGGSLPLWLPDPVRHLVTVRRRLGDGL